MDEKLKKLIDEYREAYCMPTRATNIKKLRQTHIEDENMSVKWNRDFVQKNNERFQQEVADVNRKRNLAMNNVEEKIKKYIMVEAKVNQKAAKAIFDFAYKEGHSFSIQEVGSWIERLIDLIIGCKESE